MQLKRQVAIDFLAIAVLLIFALQELFSHGSIYRFAVLIFVVIALLYRYLPPAIKRQVD